MVKNGPGVRTATPSPPRRRRASSNASTTRSRGSSLASISCPARVMCIGSPRTCTFGPLRTRGAVQASTGTVLAKGKLQMSRNEFHEGAEYQASADGKQFWAINGLASDPRGLRQLYLGIFDTQTMKRLKEVPLTPPIGRTIRSGLCPAGNTFPSGSRSSTPNRSSSASPRAGSLPF